MKIFLLLIFVITTRQTFIQELSQWMNNNLDLIEGLIQEPSIPINAEELEKVQLND
jgi:hypothetical protein